MAVDQIQQTGRPVALTVVTDSPPQSPPLGAAQGFPLSPPLVDASGLPASPTRQGARPSPLIAVQKSFSSKDSPTPLSAGLPTKSPGLSPLAPWSPGAPGPMTPGTSPGRKGKRPPPLKKLSRPTTPAVCESVPHELANLCNEFRSTSTKSEGIPSAFSNTPPSAPSEHSSGGGSAVQSVQSVATSWVRTPAASTPGSTTGSADAFELHSLDDLQKVAKLGQGASGTVEMHRHSMTGREVALKIIPAGDIAEPQRRALLLELKTFAKCRNPHIVDFYGAFFQDASIHIALEYMDTGSLQDMLDVRRTVPEDVLSTITWQVLDGLEYLHTEMRVIHRDVKPSNLVLNSEGMVKVTDFGVSGELEDDIASQQKITWVGTIYYMSPERVRGEPYRYDSDIWSLGLTLLESLSGRYPYGAGESGVQKKSLSFWEIMKQIVEEEAPHNALKETERSDAFSEFIELCVQKVPSLRGSATKLKAHPWVSNFPPNKQFCEDELKRWIKDGPLKPPSPLEKAAATKASSTKGGFIKANDQTVAVQSSAANICSMSMSGRGNPFLSCEQPTAPAEGSSASAPRVAEKSFSQVFTYDNQANPFAKQAGSGTSPFDKIDSSTLPSENKAQPEDTGNSFGNSLSSTSCVENPFLHAKQNRGNQLSSSFRDEPNPFLNPPASWGDANATDTMMSTPPLRGIPASVGVDATPWEKHTSDKFNFVVRRPSDCSTAESSDAGKLAAENTSTETALSFNQSIHGNPFQQFQQVDSSGMEKIETEDCKRCLLTLNQSCRSGNPFQQFQGKSVRPIASSTLLVTDAAASAKEVEVSTPVRFTSSRNRSRSSSQQDLLSPGLKKICPEAAELVDSQMPEDDLLLWEDRVHTITSAYSPNTIVANLDSRTALPCCVDDYLGLYLGDAICARDIAGLTALGITAVINCGAPVIEYPPHIEHVELGGCEDSHGYPLLARHLDQCLQFLERCKKDRRKVLVHCVMGLNRSASVVTAFLMLRHQLPLLDAVHKVWERRGRLPILTNGSFRQQLVQLAYISGNLPMTAKLQVHQGVNL